MLKIQIIPEIRSHFVNDNQGKNYSLCVFLSGSHRIHQPCNLIGAMNGFVCLQIRAHPWLRADISNLFINSTISKARV